MSSIIVLKEEWWPARVDYCTILEHVLRHMYMCQLIRTDKSNIASVHIYKNQTRWRHQSNIICWGSK